MESFIRMIRKWTNYRGYYKKNAHKNKHHHLKVVVKRIMITRKYEGGGIIDVTELRERQVYDMRKYFHRKKMYLYRRQRKLMRTLLRYT